MAAPFALEDLEKLQSFVDFVDANPFILNLPQLAFLKKLIIKFGGIVPEGDFQMPAGFGKCPFGGDVKSETKPTPPPAAESDDEEEVTPEMEAESEESEVELDMEANNITILEPNILYLDEKPPKIVKPKKVRAAAKAKTATKKKVMKKPKTAAKRKSKTTMAKANSEIHQEYLVKPELSITDEQGEEEAKLDPNDPLFTPKLQVKSELMEDNEDKKSQHKMLTQTGEDDADDGEDFDDNEDQDYEPQYQNDDDNEDNEDEGDSDNNDYKMFESKFKKIKLSFNDADEDEPLIMLTRSRGRPRKHPNKMDEEEAIKLRVPQIVKCRLMCKQDCTNKFNREQRQRICDHYWNLSKEDKFAYIRKHTVSKRLTKLKRKRTNERGNNCCYYLKDPAMEVVDTTELTDIRSTDPIRVCRTYFEATLCVTNQFVKKALEGYQLEVENNLKILKDLIKANQAKPKELKQILDPETGNLIIIDPNNKTKKKPPSSAPKKKRVRRKPGDPLPERMPRPIDCAQRCIHKCHTKFTEQERKQICDIFWSMDYKRRKDFILSTTEKKEIETEMTAEFRISQRPPRKYHTRFFLRIGLHGENKRVCKHFMTNTLCTNRSFITDAIQNADKTTGYYTGFDRRGQGPPANKISPERRQAILDHINSYPTWVPNKKSKSKYLHSSLNIKKMFNEYKEKCCLEEEKSISNYNYYKIFHEEFRLLFLCNPKPKKGGGFLVKNPNISHYTGEEPGGYWQDSKGERLDLRIYHPSQNMSTLQHTSQQLHETSGVTAAHQMASVVDVSSITHSVNTRNSRQPSLARLDLNPNVFDNLPTSTSSLFRMV